MTLLRWLALAVLLPAGLYAAVLIAGAASITAIARELAKEED